MKIQKIINLACLLLLINSVFFCLHNYMTFRSLWLDEAFVAVNLRGRGFLQLFSTLEYGTQFPRYYLAGVFALVKIFGYSVGVLRLLPLLFGVAGLLLWAKILWEAFKDRPAVVRVLVFLLFLMNSTLYHFAGDFKQYTGDLFFSGVGVLLVSRVLAPRLNSPGWRWWGLGLACALPILFSYTYVLVYFAACAALFLAQPKPFSLPNLGRGAALLLGSGIVLAVSYLTDLRFVHPSMYNYWRSLFIQGDTASAWMVSFLSANGRLLGEWWIEKAKTLFVGLAYLGFVRSLFKKDVNGPAFLATTGGFVLMGLLFLGAMGRYPLHADRLALFFLPLAAAMIGEGLATLATAPVRVVRWGALSLTVAVLAWTLGRRTPELMRHVYTGTHWENINPAMGKLDAARSRYVVYGDGTQAQVRAYPALPAGFEFVYWPKLDFSTPVRSGKNPWLEGAFYYLVATPSSSPEDVTTRIKGGSSRELERLDKHLYLVAPAPK